MAPAKVTGINAWDVLQLRPTAVWGTGKGNYIEYDPCCDSELLSILFLHDNLGQVW